MSGKQLIFIALCLLFIYGLFTIGSPFLLAALVAISIEPANVFLMHRMRLNRIAASTLTCTLFLLLILLLVYILGLQVFTQLVEYWKNAPSYFSSANDFIQQMSNQAEGLFDRLQPDVATSVQQFLYNLTSYVQSIINTVSSSFLSFAKGIPDMFIFLIVFCVAVYLFSFSLDTMRSSILSFFEEKSHSQVNEVIQSLKRSIFGFLSAQLILSISTYIVTLLGLLILGVSYPLAIALLVTVVDLLPILGVGSVLIPWAIYLLIVGNTYTSLGLVILFIVITVWRRVLEPKIIGDAVGIGALPALISMYIGFKLVGVIGFFIGPLVIIIYAAMRKAGLFQIKIKF